MLAKLTSENQLTLPTSVTDAVDAAEYFEVEAHNGRIILTPVRGQSVDVVRAKLSRLEIDESDVTASIEWARSRSRRDR